MPSSIRCLARSRTEAGTSSSVVFATQVASRPVGPAGSVAGRAGFPVSLTAVGVVMAFLAFLVSDRLGVLGGRERTRPVCVPGLGRLCRKQSPLQLLSRGHRGRGLFDASGHRGWL